MNTLSRDKISFEKCEYVSADSFEQHLPTLPIAEYLSMPVANLDAGKAINNSFEKFREVAMSGSGLMLIALMVGIAWISWKKRME